MKNKKTLHLNLKKKWFDMIVSRIKKEEYRDINVYWMKRLQKYYQLGVFLETVTFSNGYQKGRKQIVIELLDIKVGHGKTELGASGRLQYILKLGNIISKNF